MGDRHCTLTRPRQRPSIARARSEHLELPVVRRNKASDEVDNEPKVAVGPSNTKTWPQAKNKHKSCFTPIDDGMKPEGEERNPIRYKPRSTINNQPDQMEGPASTTSTLKSMASGYFAPLDEIGKTQSKKTTEKPEKAGGLRGRPPLQRYETLFAHPEADVDQVKGTTQQIPKRPPRSYRFSLPTRRSLKPYTTSAIPRKPLPAKTLTSDQASYPTRLPLHRATKSFPSDPSRLTSNDHYPSRLEVLERWRRSTTRSYPRSPYPRLELQYPEEAELTVLRQDIVQRTMRAKQLSNAGKRQEKSRSVISKRVSKVGNLRTANDRH